MDEPARAPRLTFAPDRRRTAATAAAGMLALVVAVRVADSPGRVLAVVAFVLLVGFAIAELVFTPSLVADVHGLAVRSATTRTTLPWPAVDGVHADVRSRLGLRSATLEIDAGDTLVVLTRRELGARPEEVADLVNALRPR